MRIRCKACGSSRDGRSNSGWLKKDSLPTHLKSEAHQRSIDTQADMIHIQEAAERAMEEEMVLEEMEFALLPSSSRPATATTPWTSTKPSREEQEMWGNHAMSNEVFDAGIDPTLAAIDERKHLERETTDFDLWNAAEYLPHEEQNDSALLLDELEQADILTELLRDARTSLSFAGPPVSYISCLYHRFGHT